MSENPLLPHGGYEKLRSYKLAQVVYDATVVFCDRFIDKRSRTHDHVMLCAINQAAYLLRRQIESQTRTFLENGGFRERLWASRVGARDAKINVPDCPRCGQPMQRRVAKKGRNSDREFWGCSRYPHCNGTRELSVAT